MKKILLLMVMMFCVLGLTSCETGNFLSFDYEAQYYVYDEETKEYITDEDIFYTTSVEETPTLALHTLIFSTNPEAEIKQMEICYIIGSFDVICDVDTRFHIQINWSQGYWYENEILVDEDFEVKAGQSTIDYDIDLEDTGNTLKIPSNDGAVIKIKINAYVDGVEVKDYSIKFNNIDFMNIEFEGEVSEDESLKDGSSEDNTE